MAVFTPTSLGNSLYADNGDVRIKGDLEVGGNIGIGLTNPKHRMHIHENSGWLAYLTFTNTETGTGSHDDNLVGTDSAKYRVTTRKGVWRVSSILESSKTDLAFMAGLVQKLHKAIISKNR